MQLLAPGYISGLSLLGGEPFEPANQPALAALVRRTRETYPQKNVWCYTGYLFEDIAAGRVGDPDTAMSLLRGEMCIRDRMRGRVQKGLHNL